MNAPSVDNTSLLSRSNKNSKINYFKHKSNFPNIRAFPLPYGRKLNTVCNDTSKSERMLSYSHHNPPKNYGWWRYSKNTHKVSLSQEFTASGFTIVTVTRHLLNPCVIRLKNNAKMGLIPQSYGTFKQRDILRTFDFLWYGF